MPSISVRERETTRAVEQHHPHERYEFVDVDFTAADTDVVIPYSKFRPLRADDIRWMDITPGTVNVGGVDTHPRLYRSNLPTRKLWARGYIVLRSTVAGYSTRLMLFTEHT